MFKNFIVKFPNTQDVYALINGELTACKVLRVVAKVDKCTSYVICESPDGVQNSFKASELYSSVDAYKKGNTVATIKPELKTLLPGCTEKVESDEEGEFFNKFFWMMVDGEPKKVNLKTEKSVVFNALTRKAIGVELPKEFYSTREECVMWNDINVVEADGTKRVQKSARRSLLLTDEQQAIIDQLCDILKKAKDAKIKLGYEINNDELMAINVTEHPNATFCYHGDVDERNQIGVDESLPWTRYRVNGFPGLLYVNDESCIDLGDKLD